MRDSEMQACYRREVGHEPPQAPAQYAWQWAYQGTPQQLRRLRQELEASVAKPVPAEQMSLC